MVVIFYSRRIWRQEENFMTNEPLSALTSSTNPDELFVACRALDGKFTFIYSSIPEVYSMYYWIFPSGAALYVFCTDAVMDNEYGSHIDNCYIQDPE